MDVTTGGNIGSDAEYKRMRDTYARFHGVAGQAHNKVLYGVVCAHKIDLATVQLALAFSCIAMCALCPLVRR
jgi:hypothetical protein